MHDWSGMRKKLEQDYLAEPLRGHIRYFATTYKHSHDFSLKALASAGKV